MDSADAARIPEAFAEYHERITGHEATDSVAGNLAKLGDDGRKSFHVDQGSKEATFILQWRKPDAKVAFYATDPGGTTHRSEGIPQGGYIRVKNPLPGEWKMAVDPSGTVDSPFVLRETPVRVPVYA